MSLSRRTRAAAALAVAALVAPVTVSSTAAALPEKLPVEEHCVVTVVDQLVTGELVTTSPDCYGSFSDAMASVGVSGAEQLESPNQLSVEQLSSFTLAVHYDGLNFTSSSISVVGVDCAGGYVNLTSTWRNRVSSTANGCPRVRHYHGADLFGGWEDTTGNGGNLSSLNNQADSIQYRT